MTSLYAPSAEDVKQRLRPFGFFFEKSLKDLIKSIRSYKDTPGQLQEFFSQCINECRQEVKSSDMNLKTNAILKLTYLEMYGFDMSWANFYILEVMSSSKFQQKRVGYLAASQSFYKDNDILMLATNLLKKDLKYDSMNDTMKMGVALSGLSTIVTLSLARDICDDLFLMLNSGKSYIRKKAVTALFKVFLQYPEALRDNFDRFVGRLNDDDLSVVSTTVSVICELSKQNPYPFVQLSPLLYQMLIEIDNNWIIIRLLKLFTNLAQIEPKLRTKILPKILELMAKTHATSVIYESINCIIKGYMLEADDYETAITCLEKLHSFCVHVDPNLRYISCILFYKIGKINPDFISNFDQLVLCLLKDIDISIRTKALELLEGAANEDNIAKIIKILIKQFVDVDTIFVNDQGIEIEIPQSYKCQMIYAILKICSVNNYENIEDFEWYLVVLSDLCVLAQDLHDSKLGYKLGEQLRNLMVKVPSMRDKSIIQVISLISNKDINLQLPQILKECYWCLGEYSNLIENGDEIIELIAKKTIHYNPDIQQILIPSLLKIFSNWCNSNNTIDLSRVRDIVISLISYVEEFITSKSFEVQERSVEAHEFLKLCLESIDIKHGELPLLITEILPSLFSSFELTPISLGTQRKLQISQDLDLQTPFVTSDELDSILEQTKISDNIESPEEASIYTDDSSIDYDINSQYTGEKNKKTIELTQEREILNGNKKQERLDNPFYLNDEDNNKFCIKNKSLIDLESMDEPITKETPTFSGIIRLSQQLPKKKKKRVKVLSDETVVEKFPDNEEIEVTNTKISNSFNKIDLTIENNLGKFDFNKQVYPSNEPDIDPELDNLKAKFASQTIYEPTNEVIVIKKKKKNKDKSKSKSKKSSKVSTKDLNIENLLE